MNYMFAKTRAKSAANAGIGAISPSVCHAFLDGKCSCCGTEIPDNTIAGNAWVIAKEGVELLCVKCRTSEKVASRVKSPPLRTHFHRSKIFLFIVELNKRDRRAWLRFIFGCRMNGDGLSFPLFYNDTFNIQFVDSIEDYFYEGDIIYELSKPNTAHSYYGDTDKKGQHCGECHMPLNAFWNPEKCEFSNPEKCKRCGFPNELQWNMRNTYESEMNRAALVNL